MQEKYNSHIIYSIILSGIIYFAIFMYKKSTWMQCQSQRRKLRRQGVKGPPPCSFLYGNLPQMQLIQSATAAAAARDACRGGGSDHDDGGDGVGGGGGGGSFVAHDYTSSLFPHFQQWRKEFGPIYTYSTGNRQHMYVNEPEVVREMSQSMSLDLGKPSYVTKALAPMLGNGILRSNGLGWAKQRKIVAPEFFMNKVKGMVGLMREAAEPVLKKWEDQSGGGGEVRVDDDFRAISADVISRACFGSSYSTGKHIFLKLRTLQTLLSQHNFLFKVPSFRFLNTKLQKEIKSLEKEIESLIWVAVQDRVRECSQAQSSPSDHDPRDLMQLILDGALQDQDLSSDSSSKHFIVDNCKNFYFAGHESTAVAASWCTMLLALHPEWQDKIRAELSQLTKGDLFDVESLVKMKSVTMVIQEALRLYPPAAFISREALEDFRMGSILIPKGVCLWTLIPTLHRDPDIWGPNANEFKPERFANGVAHACKVPQAYVPFGLGARLCLGKNFAMVQLKVLICLIVCKFRFTLSPRYKHSPSYKMIVEPGHGVRIIVRRI